MDASVLRIEKFLRERFDSKIDLSDLKTDLPKDKVDEFFRTRALAAYAIAKLARVTDKVAADSVTDGGHDLGIDAFIFDQKNKVLWLIQSKFSSSEKGGTELGDVHKFKDGIQKVINCDLNDANERIKKRAAEIESAMNQAGVQIQFSFITTGAKLSPDSRAPLDEIEKRLNLISDTPYVFQSEADGKTLLGWITEDLSPQKVTIEVALSYWGKSESPSQSFYGQVSAKEVGAWYVQFGEDLFSKNIRNFLGHETDINDRVVETLRNNPQHFFFLNNGITAICADIEKTPKFGDTTTSGTFQCTDLRVINGAQTVGCIGKVFKENPAILNDAKVLIKIISLKGANPKFGGSVTVATNSQNEIQMMDFASMDEQQIRLEHELLHDFNAVYLRLRGNPAIEDNQISLTMMDTAIALSCFEDDVAVCINQKREKNKIWDALEEAPYTSLFNSKTTATKVYNAYSSWKRLADYLEKKKLPRSRERSFSESGDHLLLHLIFEKFQPNKKDIILGSTERCQKYLDESFATIADDLYKKVWGFLSTAEPYKTAQLSRLLISTAKVAELKNKLLEKKII